MKFRKTHPVENKQKSGLGDICTSVLPMNSRMAQKAMLPSPDPGECFTKGFQKPPSTPVLPFRFQNALNKDLL